MTLPPLLQRCAQVLQASDHDTGYLRRAPIKKQAAVLVLIYQEDDKLRVLLTTRAKTMKFHGGRTAFPGGRVDATDADIVATAASSSYREADEEVGLPLNSEHVETLGVFRPYPFHQLVVTPVVAFLHRPELVLPVLKAEPREVDHIFTHSLDAILDPPLSALSESLVDIGSEHWPHEEEYHHYKDYIIQQYANTGYRYHHFRSSASPITGLTADILMDIASLVYDKNPTYERLAPNQPKTYEAFIAAALPPTDNSIRS